MDMANCLLIESANAYNDVGLNCKHSYLRNICPSKRFNVEISFQKRLEKKTFRVSDMF